MLTGQWLTGTHPPPPLLTIPGTIDLIHDARRLCTRSGTDGIKTMSRGFSGGKQVNICVYSRQQEMKTFSS